MSDEQSPPAPPARHASSPAEAWQAEIGSVHQLALALRAGVPDLPGRIRQGERALDVGGILDPTLWRASHHKLEEDLEMLRAALPLWRLGDRHVTRLAAHKLVAQAQAQAVTAASAPAPAPAGVDPEAPQ